MTPNPLSADAIESAKMLEGAGTLEYCAEHLDAARAADALRHQQEKSSWEADNRMLNHTNHGLRAALSTAEATIASLQTAELEQNAVIASLTAQVGELQREIHEAREACPAGRMQTR